MKHVLIGLIRCYQVVFSFLFRGCCRFYPSCSTYAIQAMRQHGAIKGSFLSLKRLCKCHPFNPGGIDPVPAPIARHQPDLFPSEETHSINIESSGINAT
ncbi:MAG: membrane protein insertion efficiency factor YidD [Lentisphaerales bacterium]|jgi:putative membrane protein insertion efficiency factor|nr:MAG: membrane protein insertion efficiency factor YidD [Lentisphaerales bacterium]